MLILPQKIEKKNTEFRVIKGMKIYRNIRVITIDKKFYLWYDVVIQERKEKGKMITLLNKKELEKTISETRTALEKYKAAADWDEELINEFKETDMETAEIYRNWRKFNLDKVSYFQNRLQELNNVELISN